MGNQSLILQRLKQFGCNYSLYFYFGLRFWIALYKLSWIYLKSNVILSNYCLPIIFGYRDELFYTIWTEFWTKFARKKKQVIVFVLIEIGVWLKKSTFVQFTFSYISRKKKDVFIQLKHFALLSSITHYKKYSCRNVNSRILINKLNLLFGNLCQ